MSTTVATIIGAVIGLIAAVLACVLVMPEKRVEEIKNSKFLMWVHDLINFKSLLIEKIMKVLYVLSTCVCICVGFFLLFANTGNKYYKGSSTALIGLVTMILGPIVIRLLYEGLMLFIINTKNVIEINNRLGDGTDDDPNIM